MAPAGFNHGAVTINLAYRIADQVRKAKLGVVLGAETGFLLRRDPDTVRAPDIAFVRADRLPAGPRPEAYFPGAPDLAVEVISPGDRLTDVEEKVDEYLAAGSREVWVVNPARRTVTVHRPGQNPVVLREAETVTGGDVLPGFECPLAEIFA